VRFVEMGFRFPEESGQASSGLALASAMVRRARFLWPVTICFLCFAQDFGFGSKNLLMFLLLKSMGVLILGVLILGMLIWVLFDWVC
jgi:hypothetical protein